MAAQQAHFAETIRAMKLALKRQRASSPARSSSDDGESDTSIHRATNRGQKLKRHARYVREGRLDDTGGLAYRRKVNHAGYTRDILAPKPTVYDGDGDIVPSPPESVAADEGEGGERWVEGVGFVGSVEDDAFGSVRLERLLRPLTRASELPDHPSLSVGYKSKALTQMVDEVLEMIRRERASLWKAKRLLARFRGDADWVPCEVFETDMDEMLLLLGEDGNGGERAGIEGVDSVAPSVNMVPDIEMGGLDGVEISDMAVQKAVEGDEGAAMAIEEEKVKIPIVDDNRDRLNGAGLPAPAEHAEGINGNSNDMTTQDDETQQPLATTELPQPNNTEDPEANAEDEANSEPTSQTDNKPSHSMTTRARARSPIPSPTPSASSTTSTIPTINPWYHVPSTALPDRDFGLPAEEAEDTRKLLLLYVQKQEQTLRSLSLLSSGLQRADRLRHHIYRSAKAEGHTKVESDGRRVTEMSDGEDWYDVDEWGLGWQDLKLGKDGVYGLEKGKDEAEELFPGDEGVGEGRRVGGRRRRVQRM